MLRKGLEPNLPIDNAALAAFERQHGLILPNDYREFILLNNGGQPVPAAFPIEGFPENPLGVIQAFFGLNAAISTEDLSVVLTQLKGRVPAGILPIACTEGYDFVCIDLRKKGDPVAYWDRRPFWGNEIWREEHLYLVADSFCSLLAKLQDLQPQDV